MLLIIVLIWKSDFRIRCSGGIDEKEKKQKKATKNMLFL